MLGLLAARCARGALALARSTGTVEQASAARGGQAAEPQLGWPPSCAFTASRRHRRSQPRQQVAPGGPSRPLRADFDCEARSPSRALCAPAGGAGAGHSGTSSCCCREEGRVRPGECVLSAHRGHQRRRRRRATLQGEQLRKSIVHGVMRATASLAAQGASAAERHGSGHRDAHLAGRSQGEPAGQGAGGAAAGEQLCEGCTRSVGWRARPGLIVPHRSCRTARRGLLVGRQGARGVAQARHGPLRAGARAQEDRQHRAQGPGHRDHAAAPRCVPPPQRCAAGHRRGARLGEAAQDQSDGLWATARKGVAIVHDVMVPRRRARGRERAVSRALCVPDL